VPVKENSSVKIEYMVIAILGLLLTNLVLSGWFKSWYPLIGAAVCGFALSGYSPALRDGQTMQIGYVIACLSVTHITCGWAFVGWQRQKKKAARKANLDSKVMNQPN
jgi:hypothetical protein